MEFPIYGIWVFGWPVLAYLGAILGLCYLFKCVEAGHMVSLDDLF
jgi:hypothetical protein